MRALIVVAGLLLATTAHAGTANNPDFTREQASSAWSGGQIACTDTSATVVAAAGDGRVLTVCNANATASNIVHICLSLAAATPIPCTAALAVQTIAGLSCGPPITAVRNVSVSCLRGTANSVNINYLLAR